MGNTVSAAERMASDIVHPVVSEQPAPASHKTHSMSGVPPPECPMHQKTPPPPAKGEECPVGYGGNDINPANMVNC